MRYILILLLLVSTAYGQYAPTSAKTKFVNGIAIGSRDTSQFTAADTIALTIARDSVMYYRYRGFWRPIATGGNLSAYKLISDTLFNNGYTTRARLKQGLDSLAATKVSSVGLTMPSAFNVANSPITTSGTIAVTAAGNASQYIRGDGVLANLPTNGGGGGASVSYYLNGSVNQGTIGGVTYYEMNKTPIIGAGTDFTRNSNGYIASFLTDANDPALLVIPAGNWNFETYFEASSGGGSPSFYIELYKYDGTTFTLIASNSTSPKSINDGTNIEAYFSALAVPQTTLALTDRLAVRIYVTTAGRTITLHTENNTLCQVITTFTTGLTALNGLTAQVQYFATGTSGSDFNISSATDTHTFNLPTASATNRGALSSANWTTFNNKIGPSDTASMLAPYFRDSDTTGLLSQVVRTFGTQTVGGNKTFSNDIVVNGLTVGRGSGNVAGNTSFGLVSLGSNTTGTANTAIGNAALRNNEGGTNNVGVGTNTNFSNISGSFNAAVGAFALSTNTADSNAAVGAGALAVNTTGTRNTAVGLYAGASQAKTSQRNLTGSQNTYIGASSVGSASNNSNETVIGANAIGNGSNTVTIGNSSVTGNYFNGFLKQTSVTSALVKTSSTGVLEAAVAGTDFVAPSALSGYVPTSRTITINGTSQDLSANRTFNVGTVTSVTASSPLASSGGTTPNITIQQASGSQNGFLSSTDWTTFNNKQNALTNPVTGTGTTNYLPKFTGASTIGNSIVSESGSIISILGTLNIRPAAGTSLIDLLSAGAGSKNYQLTSQIIGVSNTGFAIRNVTDSRNELIIDASGNLGLGVTPSAWGSSFRAIQLQDANIFTFLDNGGLQLTSNAFFNGSNFIYQRTAAATYYDMAASGQHRWHIAPSGTAGNAISFTQAMTLDASGNLLVGGTSSSGERLQVTGNAMVQGEIRIRRSGTQYGTLYASSGNDLFLESANSAAIYYNSVASLHTWRNNGSNAMSLNSTGLGIGTTSPLSKLHVAGAGTTELTISNSSPGTVGTPQLTRLNFLGYGDENRGRIEVTDIAQNANGSEMRLYTANTSNVITERMRITSGGNLLLGTTTDNGARLQVSGSATFSGQLTMAYGGTPRLLLRDTDAGAGNVGILFRENTTDKWTVASAGGNFQIFNEGTSSNALLFNGTTNAATFSSSVTANSFIRGSGLVQPISLRTANYTLTTNDHTVIFDATAANRTATLPAGVEGQIFVIKGVGMGVNSVTIAASSGQTIENGSSYNINIGCSDVALTIQFLSGNWNIISSHITPCL